MSANLNVGSGQTYATIQDAVDAAQPGDTIVVHAGVYNENVVITVNDLTVENVTGEAVQIVGQGTGFGAALTIAADVTGTTIEADHVTNFEIAASSSGQTAAVYLVGGNDHTEISNLTITQPGPGGGGGDNALLSGGDSTTFPFQGTYSPEPQPSWFTSTGRRALPAIRTPISTSRTIHSPGTARSSSASKDQAASSAIPSRAAAPVRLASPSRA
jgi:hypothetical protein